MKSRSKFLLAASVSLVLVLGFVALRGPLDRWRIRRLEATAENLLKQGDQHGAILTARSILQSDPADIPACRIMARSAEEDHSPLALIWRQKLVDLQPGQAGPLLDLARAAVGLGESAVAENALTQVPAHDQDTAAYHDAAAAWALSIQHYDIAEKQAEEALRFDPRNPRLRLSLAALQLAVASPSTSSTARAQLETLRKIPEFHAEATRDLLADARRRGDAPAAMALAQDLDAAPEAPTADHLLYLDELLRTRSPDFERALAALQAAATEPGHIYSIMDWMTAHGLGSRTIRWHTALPASSRKMPEPLAAAEACVAQADWTSLRALTDGPQWGDLEFLRLAFETRLFDEQSQHERGADFRSRWQRTAFSAGGNTNALSMLARMALSWGWKEQARDLWWSIADRRMGQRPALAALFELATADKDTAELYRVSRRIHEVEPTSPVARNNVAIFALLRREDLPEAHKLAAEDYSEMPTEPAIVSTYAFSLYVQGRPQEAVAVMAKLPPASMDDPSMAACNGVLLTAAGQPEKARSYLELAMREKARLFPEEVAMVQQAMQQPKP